MIQPERWKSFLEFESAVQALPTEGERGSAFEAFGRAYLQLELLAGLDHGRVWKIGTDRVPERVLRVLGLHATDVGVDFVADNRTAWVATAIGRPLTLQAKFHNDGRPLAWREIATFAGATTPHVCNILLTNARDVSSRMPPAARQRIQLIRRHDLLKLGPDFFARWSALERGRRSRSPRLTPTPLQAAAVRDVVVGFEAGAARGQLIAPAAPGRP